MNVKTRQKKQIAQLLLRNSRSYGVLEQPYRILTMAIPDVTISAVRFRGTDNFTSPSASLNNVDFSAYLKCMDYFVQYYFGFHFNLILTYTSCLYQ